MRAVTIVIKYMRKWYTYTHTHTQNTAATHTDTALNPQRVAHRKIVFRDDFDTCDCSRAAKHALPGNKQSQTKHNQTHAHTHDI